MCISLPAKVTSICGQIAEVNLNSSTRKVFLAVDGAEVGSWVLTYAGYALAVIDDEAAKETLSLIGELTVDHQQG